MNGLVETYKRQFTMLQLEICGLMAVSDLPAPQNNPFLLIAKNTGEFLTKLAKQETQQSLLNKEIADATLKRDDLKKKIHDLKNKEDELKKTADEFLNKQNTVIKKYWDNTKTKVILQANQIAFHCHQLKLVYEKLHQDCLEQKINFKEVAITRRQDANTILAIAQMLLPIITHEIQEGQKNLADKKIKFELLDKYYELDQEYKQVQELKDSKKIQATQKKQADFKKHCEASGIQYSHLKWSSQEYAKRLKNIEMSVNFLFLRGLRDQVMKLLQKNRLALKALAALKTNSKNKFARAYLQTFVGLNSLPTCFNEIKLLVMEKYSTTVVLIDRAEAEYFREATRQFLGMITLLSTLKERIATSAEKASHKACSTSIKIPSATQPVSQPLTSSNSLSASPPTSPKVASSTLTPGSHFSKSHSPALFDHSTSRLSQSIGSSATRTLNLSQSVSSGFFVQSNSKLNQSVGFSATHTNPLSQGVISTPPCTSVLSKSPHQT